jgi:hypothetical protein
MFIGHFGLALAAKKAAPRTSLGTTFLATEWIDGLWPIFLLIGIETVKIAPGDTAFSPLEFTSYPYSHSLLMVCVWGLLLGGLYFAIRRSRRGALVVGLLVVSHWVLDWFTHRPDLPLMPGGAAREGLGLWNSVTGTLIIEGLIFLIGIAIYLRTTRAKDRLGTWSFWVLVVLLVGLYLGAAFGAPPPSENALAWTALSGWLFPVWGWWIDRHRRAAM